MPGVPTTRQGESTLSCWGGRNYTVRCAGPATTVRVYVPVTLRPAAQRTPAPGTLISQMVMPVPVGMAHPAARLRLIAAETARRKARLPPSRAAVFRGRLGRTLLLKLVRRNPVNVAAGDVPGRAQTLYAVPDLDVVAVGADRALRAGGCVGRDRNGPGAVTGAAVAA